MRLTRRELLRAATASSLAGAGIYELVDLLTPAPARAAAFPAHLPEQHVLQDLRIVTSDGVEVFAPPLHSELVTATLAAGAARAERDELERRLQTLDERYPSSPAGLAVTVAWGLPYFRRYVPGQTRRQLPSDLRASSLAGHAVPVLEDAERFPSDPHELALEANEVAVLLRSDSLDRIAEAFALLFGKEVALFQVTSRRRGFAGGGFEGGRGLPKQMAAAAGIRGADLIPDTAELFLGFTSTQKQMPGRERINNLETLGYTDVHLDGYFAHGTHMHVSHLFEDLEAWYRRFDHGARAAAMFRPGIEIAPGTLTVKQGPRQAESAAGVARDYRRYRQIGHSGSIQPASRLQRDTTGPDGVLYEAGMPIPHRADFNTLDNPFSFSSAPERDRLSATPAAGLHFVVFNPTSDDFRRNRLAMDGLLTGAPPLHFTAADGQGVNAVLKATHRQNFLVPPRAHRSFPLSELRA